jgi:hypothetical protein
VHRWLGRVTGLALLLALVPTGTVLAFDAKGGWPVTLGFLLSGAIVFGCTIAGTLAARRGDLVRHRHAMLHVLAQMSVAVTSRALLVAFDTAGIDADLAYVVALWLPVLGSAAIVELLLRRAARRPWELLTERMRRIFHAQATRVRARPVLRPVARLGR